MTCRSTRDIADSVFAPHGAAVRDFNLETFDLLGEFDALRVGEASHLSQIVSSNVEYFAHEVDDALRFIESRRRDVDIEHHFPLAGPHRLVETKPNFSTATKWRRLADRGREK